MSSYIMAKRNNLSLEGTPNYELLGKPDCFTVKIYYNGRLKSNGQHKEYTGGSFAYFDFVDIDKLGMIELWEFAEDIGIKDKESIKFWHKLGGTIMGGRFLENDLDVLNVRNYIPTNYEVELYVEHLDGPNAEAVNENITDHFGDNEYDFVEYDRLVDTFVSHDLESSKEKMLVSVRENTNALVEDDGEKDICADSDGLESDYDSGEDEVRSYPLFDPEKESEEPELKLGLVFSSKKEAKFTIESHCIRNGRPVKFVKNDNIRLWAKCNTENCQWSIHVAKMTNDNCWQVRTFEGIHTNCARDFSNKCINSTWVGKTFANRFSINPKLGSLEFRDEICTTLQSDFSRKVAYLAKRKALRLVQGTADEQFRQIRKYCAELKRSDVGATVVLKLTEDDEGPRLTSVSYTTMSRLRSSTCIRGRVGQSSSSPVIPVAEKTPIHGSTAKK